MDYLGLESIWVVRQKSHGREVIDSGSSRLV